MCLAAKHELLISAESNKNMKGGKIWKIPFSCHSIEFPFKLLFSLARFSAFFPTDWRWRRARRFSISTGRFALSSLLLLLFWPIFRKHTHTLEYAGGCFVFLGFLAKLIAYGFVVSCHRQRFCCCCRKLKHKYRHNKCLPHTHTHTRTHAHTGNHNGFGQKSFLPWLHSGLWQK